MAPIRIPSCRMMSFEEAALKMQFIFAAAVVIAASVLGPSPAQAQLYGHNTTGDAGLLSGSQASPGLYLIAPMYVRYDADTFRNSDGDRVSLDPERRGDPAVNAYVLGLIWGGLLFGFGMAVLGYCPGTLSISAGQGALDAWVGIAGGLVGGLIFTLLYPTLKPLLGPDLGPISLFSTIGDSLRQRRGRGGRPHRKDTAQYLLGGRDRRCRPG